MVNPGKGNHQMLLLVIDIYVVVIEGCGPSTTTKFTKSMTISEDFETDVCDFGPDYDYLACRNKISAEQFLQVTVHVLVLTVKLIAYQFTRLILNFQQLRKFCVNKFYEYS